MPTMPTPAEKDACDLLDADHIAVKHLFVDYARLAKGSPPGGPDGDRLSLARKICNELTVHATIEEEIFYPALRHATDAGALVDEAQAEHQEAKELIAQIEAATSADDALDTLVDHLAGAIEHHVKEERDCLFPKARASGLDLMAIAAQLKERQQELEAQMA
jgi:iron-sulfur cluster repair protein YtfE (RIC family)